MNLIKPKLESTNINLQINFTDSKKSNWSKLRKLDQSFIGTLEYMGFAWFWDCEIKHYMRDSTTKQKKYIHDSFLLNKVPFKFCKIGKQGYFKTNKLANKIVVNYFNNFGIN
tara:strand:+ start:424 stop:759 length:336 start_codon:yes stop_codon:yes gene_type:complete